MKNRTKAAIIAAGVVFSSPLVAEEGFTLMNGSFSEGTDRPVHWKMAGGAGIVRDVVTFKSAPASLRVEVAGGKGEASQSFKLAGAWPWKPS